MTARVVYLHRAPRVERSDPAPEFWWIHSPAVQIGMGAIIFGAFVGLMAWECGACVVDAVMGAQHARRRS